MIQHMSYNHKGGFYHYRLHNFKIDKLSNGLSGLKEYLNCVLGECPDEYFNNGPRSSSLKFQLNDLDLKQITGHEVCGLTRKGLDVNSGRYKTAHSKVQVFMLENDSRTIAVEAPIWMEYKELENFSKIFNTKEALTGHIDLLRIENGKIWVWDYKPGAFKERYAATQVFFYALMLSKRTGIALDEFRCGYFDENYAFVFKPEISMLKNNSVLNFE
ncbi:MAG: PD-(D/E)XK nuclease family protein [Nanoarchaeota archaeon]|nr:PD-(D/E)XK nuclease family protein [Nanoarchaeota archaeon]